MESDGGRVDMESDDGSTGLTFGDQVNSTDLDDVDLRCRVDGKGWRWR
jgi:hypothetical protein